MSLPLGWATAYIGDLFTKIVDGSHNPPPGVSDGVPMLSARNIENGRITFEDFRLISPEAFAEEQKRIRLREGDVLLTIVGSIGRSAIVADGIQKFSLQRSVAALSPACGNSKFWMYQVQSPSFQRELTDAARGTAQKGVYLKVLSELHLLLAPEAEQDRIVGEIEKQFTRLDDAVAALKRVQANLKRYRASVLKAACEGRLVPTEAELARKERRDYEPASELLKRILAERRTKWESEQLTKMISAGKRPENDDWKNKYKNPEGLAEPEPYDLPTGWCWSTISEVAECLDGIRVPVNKDDRQKRGGSIPYYGANGPVGFIDEFLFDEPLVLVVEDETFTGRTTAFSYLIKGKSWVNNHAHVLRASAAVSPEYLNYALAFYPFTPRTTGSTGRRKLTQKALMSAPFPLPPKAEQNRIVAEIEKLLTIIDNIASIGDAKCNAANMLREVLLRYAFSGKLVPQDPNDEPASVLLERIRAERALQAAAKPTRKARTNRGKAMATEA